MIYKVISVYSNTYINWQAFRIIIIYLQPFDFRQSRYLKKCLTISTFRFVDPCFQQSFIHFNYIANNNCKHIQFSIQIFARLYLL